MGTCRREPSGSVLTEQVTGKGIRLEVEAFRVAPRDMVTQRILYETATADALMACLYVIKNALSLVP